LEDDKSRNQGEKILTNFYIDDVDALLLYGVDFRDQEMCGVNFIIPITAQEELHHSEAKK
jgi:hypothetical protein